MENENSLSRRSLLCGLAFLTLGFVPDKAIAASKVKVLANGKVELLISQNTALRKVGGVVQFEDSSGRSLALVRTSKAIKGFKAIELKCTHEGGELKLLGDYWQCQRHLAEFAGDGKLKSGPSGTTSLRTVAVKATKTKVTVG
ncbi:MAG: Rieske (2Fe-2S) protein [Actinomycetota bacterium]